LIAGIGEAGKFFSPQKQALFRKNFTMQLIAKIRQFIAVIVAPAAVSAHS
jgi:hypothetical protein